MCANFCRKKGHNHIGYSKWEQKFPFFFQLALLRCDISMSSVCVCVCLSVHVLHLAFKPADCLSWNYIWILCNLTLPNITLLIFLHSVITIWQVHKHQLKKLTVAEIVKSPTFYETKGSLWLSEEPTTSPSSEPDYPVTTVKAHFGTVLIFMPRFSKSYLFLKLSNQNLLCIYYLPIIFGGRLLWLCVQGVDFYSLDGHGTWVWILLKAWMLVHVLYR
jgi:hypothetical protein